MNLMFQGTVFPFCLFSDDDKVKIVVPRLVTLQATDADNISKEIQLIPAIHSNIRNAMACFGYDLYSVTGFQISF